MTVGAGVTYGQLAPYIDGQGFALHNLASLPHVSVAGACATATHGSGNKNGNLSTAVSALEIVTADGDVVTLSRQKDGGRFPGAAVALGGLGVVTKVTLDVQPTFQVRQVVYEICPWRTWNTTSMTFSRVATASVCSPIGKTTGPLRSG